MSPHSQATRGGRFPQGSESDLEFVLDRVCESYWVRNLRENREYLSPRFWKLLGQPIPADSSEEPGQWCQFLHADEQRLIAEGLRAHIDSGGEIPFRLDLRFQHASGQPIWLRCEAWVIAWDEVGQPLRMVGTHRDITVDKLQQVLGEEISELRARYIEHASEQTNFFQYLLDKILLLTGSEYGFIGQILDGDTGKFLKTYWLTDISWDAETKRFFDENAPKGLVFKNLDTLFGAVIRTGRPLLTNDPPNHPAAAGIPPGHPPLRAFMGIPIYYSGRFIAMAGVANRPAGYNDQLYQQLEPYFQVVGEVIHAKLIQDQLDAQVRLTLHNDRLASIGQLAAGVGHEINNPLSIISGQLYVLDLYLKERRIEDPELRKGFEKIERSVNRIATIVGGLKTFSRSDDESISHFQLQLLVEETLLMLRDIFAKEGVELELVGPAVSGQISGHRNRVQQVLVNLMMNAKDATESKSDRRVTVETFRSSSQLGFVVRDNGCGIPEDQREKIFEPFFTTKGLGNRGTGIGLAIVSNILKDHQARIQVRSELGLGTEFRVDFPQVMIGGDLHGGAETRAAGSENLQGLSVLVVDDEEDIRLILQRILTSQSAQVAVAANGFDALDILRRNPYDLVLSDIKMPGLSGFQLFEEVKKLPRPPEFMLITGGVDMSHDQQVLVHQHRLKVIPKPFNLEQVLTTLRGIRRTGRR
ncbi:MAG: ATP-binding protein [Planctomycetota bacterium]|jgi:signal transduction histidine kinase|nr:ATP-binding protein [Blastopirellula sp.]